jgi:hypothetical protein
MFSRIATDRDWKLQSAALATIQDQRPLREPPRPVCVRLVEERPQERQPVRAVEKLAATEAAGFSISHGNILHIRHLRSAKDDGMEGRIVRIRDADGVRRTGSNGKVVPKRVLQHTQRRVTNVLLHVQPLRVLLRSAISVHE